MVSVETSLRSAAAAAFDACVLSFVSHIRDSSFPLTFSSLSREAHRGLITLTTNAPIKGLREYMGGDGGWLVGGGSHYLAMYTLLTLCVCVCVRTRSCTSLSREFYTTTCEAI